MKLIKFLLLILIFFSAFDCFAGKLEKAFEKLKSYDYFDAKDYFEKSLDDDVPAAAYGLSSIYYSNKNPFYNPDSARRYILIAQAAYVTTKEKTKNYYRELGVNDSSINALSELICADAFKKYIRSDSVESYNHFLTYFSSCGQSTEAAILRNSAAFEIALDQNTSAAFKGFMAGYPQSKEYSKALELYNEKIYSENTSDNTIESYENFLVNFPESPFRKKAEEMIYELSVPDKTVDQYAAFARRYKNSPFIPDAWRKLYALSMTDFKEETYNKFKADFPDYPFPDELQTDFRLQNFLFLPFESSGLWGYINENGEEMIKPSYNETGLFYEGLAVVSLSNKFGYINKSGKIIIQNKFNDAEEFNNGHAIVMKDSLYGAINKSGEIIIKPEYDELLDANEDLFIGVKKGLSGYINSNGIAFTPFNLDVAGEFQNGFAIISKEEKFGLMNTNGIVTVSPSYDELVKIDDGLYKALNENEMWGIIDVNGKVILPFQYDAIGEFSEGLAIVALEGKCGYVNKSGAIIIPLKYVYSENLLTTAQFENGYALIKQKYKSLLFDTLGTLITFSGVEDYGRPSKQLFPVKKNKRWGYCDYTGKIIIPCKYDFAEQFQHRFAKVTLKKFTGLIDTTGTVFIQPVYEDINILENAIQVRNNGEWGLLSNAGVLLVPCIYKKIELVYPTIARASGEKGFTYINLESGKIIYSSDN